MTVPQMEAAMIEAVRQLLGPGYVSSFYEQMAQEFIDVAKAYKRGR